MEAFKAGQIDLRSENISKNWATAYDFPAVARGLVIKRDFVAPPADRHAGLRDEHAPSGVRQSAGAPGDGRGVRLRVGEQEPVLRQLHAHAELLQQQPAGLVGHSAGRRTEAAGAVSQGSAAGVVHRAVQAAGDRRLGQQPRAVAPCAGAAAAGRLVGEGAQAGRQERRADELHHPAGRAVAGARWRCPMCNCCRSSASMRGCARSIRRNTST